MTRELVEKLVESRDKIAMPTGSKIAP